MTALVLAFLLGGVAGAVGVCGWAWLVASQRAEQQRLKQDHLRAVLQAAHRELDLRRQADPSRRH